MTWSIFSQLMSFLNITIISYLCIIRPLYLEGILESSMFLKLLVNVQPGRWYTMIHCGLTINKEHLHIGLPACTCTCYDSGLLNLLKVTNNTRVSIPTMLELLSETQSL